MGVDPSDFEVCVFPTAAAGERNKTSAKKDDGRYSVTAYVAKEGDTLWSVAGSFGLAPDTVIGSNPPDRISRIKEGTILRIPDRDGIFVRPIDGERVGDLSSFYGADEETACRANGIKPESPLSSKMDIFLPGANFAAVIQTDDGRIGIAGEKGLRSVKGMLWPLRGRITGQFGRRTDPDGYGSAFHSGLDIAAPAGSTVLSALGGTVVYSGWMGGYGLTVVVEHENGMISLYGHCSELAVTEGERVFAGQPIAFVGSTGRSTGSHLHFEVRINNLPVDPLSFLR